MNIVKTALALMIAASSAAIGQTRPINERPRWEFGEFEWIRDFSTNADVARWTVGDSVVYSLKSLDDMVEQVTHRRLPKPATQHIFFAILGDAGWEMVSCTQVDPTDAVRRQTMTCWFKRQNP
jgi:hypothetical protein